ncbi:hypothetical protein EVAR_14081_1 [Eumeta japonica]|uniref:RNase H type-1 domain-containing protein n=1 Tax=Eumeta variegata TaxID=151549 RepID=A0A4C1UPJ2_EUMVA|nr:hypothetical protein EVAR_14081_1 [Eumeta japonica]
MAHAERRDILDIVAEDNEVHLFCECVYIVRAQAETTGNERADGLARNAAPRKKTAVDYDELREMAGEILRRKHRLKLKNPSYCAWIPDKVQDIVQVL